MPGRRYYIDQALSSFKGLTRALAELTEDEILECLRLESSSRRRQSVLDRLISRAVRLNELRYSHKLKEKFHHGHSQSLEDHVRR